MRAAGLALVLCVGCDIGNFARDWVPEPLIAADVSGSVDGRNFAPQYGVSGALESGAVGVMLGTGGVWCPDIGSNLTPPGGIYVNIEIPEATLGVASEQRFTFTVISGSRGGRSVTDETDSEAGTAQLTSVADEALAMRVDYSDTIEGRSYSLSGQFEVKRCP